MPVTALGLKYAKQVHDGQMLWPDDVPERRRRDTYDSYLEMGYTPEIDPLVE